MSSELTSQEIYDLLEESEELSRKRTYEEAVYPFSGFISAAELLKIQKQQDNDYFSRRKLFHYFIPN